ncbi:hypothetical protein HY407_01660 [Candidatus Gottesmanbacteria bacterium]|nr:hypothetical protein [Candidatus Gottesmanbacteria bacterium]
MPNDSITCGRQWPLPNLTQEQKEKILEASQKIGAYMKQNKYKGFFGLDFIIEENTNKIFVSECNARFTASTPFYTSLELKEDEIPLIAYHIAAFLGIRLPHKIMTKCTGTQIIVRNNQAAKVKINNNLLSGTYIYKGNNIQFINDNYEVNKLKPKEFIILPQRPDKLVDTNEEIARIELIEEVVTGSQLKNNIKNIIDILRKKLLVK